MELMDVANGLILRMDVDESVQTTLINTLIKKQIKFAKISAIGALKDVELGYFNNSDKKYVIKKFPGPFELLNLSGNISLLDDQPFAHLHVSLADSNFSVIGGHLFDASVAVTLEIFVEKIEAKVNRVASDDKDLKLWKFI